MSRKSVYRRASDLLGNLDKNIGITEGSLELQIIKNNWVEVVGDIGKKTDPIRFHLGHLLVYAEHSIYINEIRLFEKIIIKHYKTNYGIQINKCTIRKGKIDWENKFKIPIEESVEISTDNIELIKKIQKL